MKLYKYSFIAILILQISPKTPSIFYKLPEKSIFNLISEASDNSALQFH